MAQVVFKQGNQVNLPVNGTDSNSLFFVNDDKSLWKSVGAGLPLAKISDVIVVDELPTSDILSNKIYVLNKLNNIEIYIHEDNKWKTIVAGGAVVDDERVDILFNLKNKKDTLTYDAEGNIVKMVTTGEVESVIDYSYDADGNIVEEKINRQGHISTNTFSYDVDGNIVEINTKVVEL